MYLCNRSILSFRCTPALLPGAGSHNKRRNKACHVERAFLLRCGKKTINQQTSDYRIKCNNGLSARKKDTVEEREKEQWEGFMTGELGKAWLTKRHLNGGQNGVKEQAMRASGERVFQENRTGNAKALERECAPCVRNS